MVSEPISPPRESTPPPSITLLFSKVPSKLTVFDASQYIIRRACSTVNHPGGGSTVFPTRHAARLRVSRFGISQTNHFSPACCRVATSFHQLHQPWVAVGTDFCRHIFYHFWCPSRRSTLWKVRRHHECVCCIFHPSSYWRVEIHHSWEVLPSHSHRCCGWHRGVCS